MKRVLLFVCFFNILFSYSQDFYEDYNEFIAFFNSKNPEPIERLNRFGYHHYFQYNIEDIKTYKNNLKTLEKIKYVYVKIHKNINLDEVVNHLALCPNIELIKFDNGSLFGSDTTKISFPKNLNKLPKLKNIIFYSFNNWDYNKGFKQLKKVEKLKGIAFYSFHSNILMNKYFQELDLTDVAYIARNIPQIPKNNNFESLILKCDYYNNKEKQYLKTLSQTKLKKLLLSISFEQINDTILNELKHIQGLEKLTIGSPIKNSDSFFKTIGKNNPKITELNLTNCQLNSLSENIKYFEKLNTFYSLNNEFTKLPYSFYNLNQLKNIEIQGSKLKKLDENIKKLTKLNCLKIYYNKIKELPENIGYLKNLDSLFINNNFIDKLPESIGNLKKLKKLEADNNLITELPNSICNLSELRYLNLEYNYIEELPKRIGKLKKLKSLNFEANFLSKLPNSFSQLQNLDLLNLTANNITYLPKKIGNLKNLKNLKGNSNFIKKLPESFGELSNLERLELSHNNITSLPETFGHLKKLKFLFLNNKENHSFQMNRYDHIKEEFIKDSTKVRLARTKNNLIKLPKNFYKLNNLHQIDLSDNIKLNEDIFKIFKKCESKNYSLDIARCNIKELPKSGWSNIFVRDLNLKGNTIKALPKDIKNAPYLNSLNLYKNSKNLDTYRNNKSQINLLLVEQGVLSENELPKTEEMAIAYANVANKKSYSNKKNKYQLIIQYANKAMSINKEIALKTLYHDNYIEALYKTKHFKKCVDFADVAIQKDTSNNIRFLNSIIPNLEYKALSLLKLKDTLNSFKTFKTLADKFNPQSWSETALLAKKLNDKNSSIYFNNLIEYYKDELKTNPNSWGTKLSLLEVYIIAQYHLKTENYIKRISKETVTNTNYKLLLDYLKIVSKISQNRYSRENIEKLIERIKTKKTTYTNWSFDLLLLWNELNNLNSQQKSDIKTLTSLLST